MSDMKLCKRCNQEFPRTAEYWHKDRSTKDGFCHRCKACNGSAVKAWISANHDRYIQKQQEWRDANVEFVAQRRKVYNVRQRENIRLRGIKYRLRHPEIQKARIEATRMKRVGMLSPIYEAQGGRCKYCGCELGKRYDVDHIVPLTIEINNDLSNLALCCRKCNAKKGTRRVAPDGSFY